MKKLFVSLVVAALLAATGAHLVQESTAQSVRSTPVRNRAGPGYVGTFYYTLGFAGSTVTAVAVNTGITLDTTIALYPFSPQDSSFTAQSIDVRTVTGVVNCAVKLVIYPNNIATGRPTGTPIAGSNTAGDCSGSNTTQTTTITYTFSQGVSYWYGQAYSTGASSLFAMASTSGSYMGLTGRATMGSNVGGVYTAPYTYATDVMTLDLSAASFTNIGVSGVPLMHLRCAATC